MSEDNDQPDKAIDAQWAEEAESRIDAYDRGELSSVSVHEVIEIFAGRHQEVLQSREAETDELSAWNDAKHDIRARV